ncbi:unnamed protein product [Camellia sinensis]
MAVAIVRAFAPRDFMALMILSKKDMSKIVSSSVHQFGGDRLGNLASLQACENLSESVHYTVEYLNACEIDASLHNLEFLSNGKKIFARKVLGPSGEVGVAVFIGHFQILGGATKSCDVVNCDVKIDSVAELRCFLEDLRSSGYIREIDSC